MELQNNKKIVPVSRKQILKSFTEKIALKCGGLYVTITYDEKELCEVFAKLGKPGWCISSCLESICRLISLALRCNIDVQEIVSHLKGNLCYNPVYAKGVKYLSCSDAIAKVIEKAYNKLVKDGDFQFEKTGRLLVGQEKFCKSCGGLLVFQEGCFYCRECGFSKCD